MEGGRKAGTNPIFIDISRISQREGRKAGTPVRTARDGRRETAGGQTNGHEGFSANVNLSDIFILDPTE
jgi:hypothetical protein